MTRRLLSESSRCAMSRLDLALARHLGVVDQAHQLLQQPLRQVGVLEAVHGEAATRVSVAGLGLGEEELADSIGNGNRRTNGLGKGRGLDVSELS